MAEETQETPISDDSNMVKTAEKIEETNNKISSKTSQKAREVLSALQKIANGSEEETVKNLRDDLDQYGGTNDVTFIYGNHKKGIQHIAEKHGAKTLLKVFDTVVDGKIKRFVAPKKTVIIGKGNYEAVLSLDENGNKKTWLLSGWDITNENKKSSDVNGEVSTQSATTQIKPTFSRQDLGAELNNIISNPDINLNPDVKNSEQTRETDKGVELYSEDNSPLNTNDDEKLISKALYTINKEAKRIRDVRENLKEFLFEHEELNETTLEYLRAKYPNITFDPEKGAVYVDEYDGTYTKEELYDYIWNSKGKPTYYTTK